MGHPESPSGPVQVSANSERRKWTLVLTLAIVLLIFHAAQSDLHSKISLLPGCLVKTASDPWSLDFKGNEAVGTVQLSPCEHGVDCGYIVCAACHARRWPGSHSYAEYPRTTSTRALASHKIPQIAVTRRRATVGRSHGHVMMNPGSSVTVERAGGFIGQRST
jgi:hypothetical protein